MFIGHSGSNSSALYIYRVTHVGLSHTPLKCARTSVKGQCFCMGISLFCNKLFLLCWGFLEIDTSTSRRTSTITINYQLIGSTTCYHRPRTPRPSPEPRWPLPGLRKRQVHHLFFPQTQRCNYYKQDPGKHILNPNTTVIFAFALSSIILHQGTRFPYLCTDYILQPKVIY